MATLTSKIVPDRHPHYKKRLLISIVLVCALMVFGLLALRYGSVYYSLEEISMVLKGQGTSAQRAVLLNVRLPRLLIAMIVGMNLSLSGALLQAVMRNPLADPGLTGVSSGASLAAITIMLVFPAYAQWVPLAAFIGGCIACALVYALAWQKGVDPVRVILAGVAVNAIFGGGTGLLSILYSDRIQGVLMWLNGSLSAKSWHHFSILLPYSLVGLVLALACTRWANLLQLGDDMAKNLGVKVNLARIILSLAAAYLAGISVAIVGMIGFVGLVVPHITRLLIGSDYKYLIPLSALMGACILLIGDLLARTVFIPVELPVGVIMAVTGGPFFLYLLRKQGRYNL